MKIGIDIDDTLIYNCESLVSLFNRKHGKSLEIKNNTSDMRFHEFLGISKEELYDLYKEHDAVVSCEDIKPIEGASDFLRLLKKEHEIFLITARPKIAHESAKQIIQKHFPNQNLEIKFIDKKSKGEFCKSQGIGVIVEDDKDNALSCVDSGIKVILLNKPWNLGVGHEKIIRVNNWQEIFEEIKKHEEENGY